MEQHIDEFLKDCVTDDAAALAVSASPPINTAVSGPRLEVNGNIDVDSHTHRNWPLPAIIRTFPRLP
jgi:hypothetical protein